MVVPGPFQVMASSVSSVRDSLGLYVFKKPGWWLLALSWLVRTAGAVQIWLRGAPVDSICVHCGKCTAGRALCRVCSVAAGAAGVGVVGAIAVGSLTAWVAGADVDVAGATSARLDVSGLTASGWHSPNGHEHIYTVHHQWLGPGRSNYWLCRWWWQGVTGSWHHWGQIQFGQQRMKVSCDSLTGCGTLLFGWHVGWGNHIQHWHVGECAWSLVVQWCIALAGITFLQENTSEHWLVCYSMLVEISISHDQSTLYGWAILWQSWWLL